MFFKNKKKYEPEISKDVLDTLSNYSETINDSKTNTNENLMVDISDSSFKDNKDITLEETILENLNDDILKNQETIEISIPTNSENIDVQNKEIEILNNTDLITEDEEDFEDDFKETEFEFKENASSDLSIHTKDLSKLKAKGSEYKKSSFIEKSLLSKEDMLFFTNGLMTGFTGPKKTQLSDYANGELTEEELTKAIMDYLEVLCVNKPLTLAEKDEVVSYFKKSLWGYERIEPLINDDEISDIKILAHNKIRVKRLGKRESVNTISFEDEEEYARFVSLIAAKNNINIGIKNAIKPFTDKSSNEKAILRFNITTPYINTNGEYVVHIRKVLKEKVHLDELIRREMITEEIKEYLLERITSAKGIIFTGKGASGKSTLMNAMLARIPYTYSGLVIQESEELFDDDHPDLMFQKVVINKGDGAVQYTLKDLSINGLLVDLDYFVIGEIKGGEAAYFMNASYTGHRCWASVHGVNSQEALNKLTDYVTYETKYSKEEILKMLRFMDTVIYLESYKVAEISEVAGYDEVTRSLIYKPIFKNGVRVDGKGTAKADENTAFVPQN